MDLRGLRFERQRALPLEFKGLRIAPGYRLDFVVEGRMIVELKSVDSILPVHKAQLLTYLRLSGIGVGLLVNFRVAALRHGLRRMTLNQTSPSPRLPVTLDIP